MMWLTAAVCSSVFAGLTSILAKCGIRKTDSDVATAMRTLVVLLFSWVMVFIVGSAEGLKTISARSALFLVLSGLATGASWICYFKALSMGDVNKVVPIDKSSTVMSVLLAMVLFHETQHLVVRLICTALIGAGILLMVERKASTTDGKGPWMLYALLSAVFAALTSVLSKLGMTDVESNLATALRTGVVLVMALVIVLMKGKQGQLLHPDRKELGFIILSGLATGASWLCYYYAIQHGVVSVVVPIDKMSILVSVGFSRVFLGERLSRRAALGLSLMAAGALAMAIFA